MNSVSFKDSPLNSAHMHGKKSVLLIFTGDAYDAYC